MMIQYEQSGSVPAKINQTSPTLPVLLDRAAAALVSAKSSAEVLEAHDMARVVYDAAKSAGRLAKAKQAHDTLLAEIYRAQADALTIEARAKMRMAEEYGAAQERGEVAKQGKPVNIPDQNVLPTAEDIGLTPKIIHEARQIRDAEVAQPGITRRALDAMLERGEEPTRAKLNREVLKPKQIRQKVMNQTALWIWGRLRDFERDAVLDKKILFLVNEMTGPMRADVKRLAPLVRGFLEKLENAA